MHPKSPPNYLAGYPVALAEQVQRLIEQGLLADMLLQKYPLAHAVRTDKALYDYVLESKDKYLRNAGPSINCAGIWNPIITSWSLTCGLVLPIWMRLDCRFGRVPVLMLVCPWDVLIQ